jgi:hypothetical protein
VPSPIREALQDLGSRVDEDLLPALLAAASLDTATVQADFDARGVARHDVASGATPDRAQLDQAAHHVLRQSIRTATVRGAVAGLAGFAAIPPEAVAAMVQLLHLGQRLAIIYGHDPNADRGRIWLLRALAAAFDVELPRQGRWDLSLSHLRETTRGARATHASSTALVAQTFALRAATTVGARVTRWIPGLGAGLSAAAARRSTRRQGRLMIAVFQRSWGGEWQPDTDIEDAVEV